MGGLRNGWAQIGGTEVRWIDGGRSKYLLGEYVCIRNGVSDEGCFLSLEEGVHDHRSLYLDAETILLQHLGFAEDK